MTVLNANLDFNPLVQPTWTVFNAYGESTSFSMWDSSKSMYFSGSFTYPDKSHVNGTVTSVSYQPNDYDQAASFSGLRLDAATVQTKVVGGSGLWALLLAGNDTINGGLHVNGFAGDDRLNASYRFDGVAMSADGGSGTDTVAFNLATNASLLSGRAECTSFAGASVITLSQIENLTGSKANDTLAGDGRDNVLNGDLGTDTVSYAALSTAVTVDLARGLATGQGTDTLVSIENAIGGRAADLLIGSDGANRLDGGAGVDTLRGGLGNDTYVVDSLSDVVVETATGGSDTIETGLDWTLRQAYVENLTLVGHAVNGTGNTLANRLIGNDLANRLDGAAGADTLQGGAGNDTYLVDNAGDTVIEAAGQGTDTVISSVSKTLSNNVENLTLTGTANLYGNGNELANVLIGNAGDNVLAGRGGADTLKGGAGDDTYDLTQYTWATIVETSTGGRDTVKVDRDYTLGSYLENLTLTGSESIHGTGNSAANRLTGNAGDNVLDGRAGADTMAGGAGNDTYVVDLRTDVVIEGSNAGYDTVQSRTTFTLGANLERLQLTGTASVDGTGNAGANDLLGNSGNNRLDGQGGADRMWGGAGNDTYVVDNVGDQVEENSGEGQDTVLTSVSWTMGHSIETGILTGSLNLQLSDSEAYWEDNRLVGNGGNNRLIAHFGDDTLEGGAGNDTLSGGDGRDTFVFGSLSGSDVISDFEQGLDVLSFDTAAFGLADGDPAMVTMETIGAPGGHSAGADVVVASTAIAGSINATTVAAAIGQATEAYQVGDKALFAVHNGSDSAVYLFQSSGHDAVVSASELTRVVWMAQTPVDLRWADLAFTGP